MAITEFAKKYHERMFPGYVSDFLRTDPEFIERFDNFAFDEVVNQKGQGLDDKTRFMAILATLLGCQGIDEFKCMLPAALRFGVTPIEAKEIVGSYCPGSYDLSIDGKKFAGISQRRLRSGVAVQIYLCINGSGKQRAEIIKQFYAVGLQGETTKFAYPEIKPEVMASLAELLDVPLTVDQVMTKLLFTLKDHAEFLFADQLQGEELPLFESYYDRVVDRNEKIMQAFR